MGALIGDSAGKHEGTRVPPQQSRTCSAYRLSGYHPKRPKLKTIPGKLERKARSQLMVPLS